MWPFVLSVQTKPSHQHVPGRVFKPPLNSLCAAFSSATCSKAASNVSQAWSSGNKPHIPAVTLWPAVGTLWQDTPLPRAFDLVRGTMITLGGLSQLRYYGFLPKDIARSFFFPDVCPSTLVEETNSSRIFLAGEDTGEPSYLGQVQGKKTELRGTSRLTVWKFCPSPVIWEHRGG